MFRFEPSYHRLHVSEREFVDWFVAWVEEVAVKAKEPLSVILMRPLPPLDARAQAFLDREIVATAIGDRVREIDEQNRLSEYKTLRTLQNMAQANIANFVTFDASGEPLWHLDRATPDQMEAIKSVEVDESLTDRGAKKKIKITLHDKVKSVELLMKYQGLLGDDGEAWRKRKAAEQSQTIDALPHDISENDAATQYQKLLEADQ